MLDIFLIYSLC